jgi:hypothetical protein
LLVHVGDDPERISGHQGVNVRFDQRAGIELGGLELLLQPLLRGDVAGGGKNSTYIALRIAKDGSVE